MKKFYYLATGIATILVTIIACEKSDIAVDEALLNKVDGLQTVQKGELSSRAEKNDICHYDEYDGWKVISISVNAVDAHMKHNDGEHFDTVLEDADGDGYYPENECGIMGDKDSFDCDDDWFAYSPEGTYTFVYLNIPAYTHYYTITEFDPISREFSGTGYNLNPNTEVITGTVDETGALAGNILYDNGYTLDITGTVGKCGGIISLDDFYPPAVTP